MKNTRIPPSIPAWFSLLRYQRVPEFSSREWFYILSSRRLFFREVEKGLSETYYEELIGPLFRENVFYNPEKEESLSPEESEKQMGAIVNDMLVLTVIDYANMLKTDERYNAAWQRWNDSADSSDLDESINDFKTYSSSDRVYAEVDLNAPQRLAVEAFAKWFAKKKEARQNRLAKGGSITSTDFAKWAKYQVLPYLDLKLWSEIHHVTFPHWMLANALFPNWDGDTAEILRKTTMKLAKQALDNRTVETLMIQAHVETGPI